jgi:thiamine pyrophosphokinase
MRFLIIAGGAPVKSELLKELSAISEKIICADQGAETARRNNITPDAIIGDFDSVSEGTLALYKKTVLTDIVESYNQDMTDLEKSILLALEQGATEIDITCATGKQNDHFLHSLGLLAKYNSNARLAIIGDEDVITLNTTPFHSDCHPGERISLIPWGGKVQNVSTAGLKYALNREDLIPGLKESISNETLEEHFSVEFDSGMLLLIRENRLFENKDHK